MFKILSLLYSVINFPPHHKRTATLPCEIGLEEIIMFKNCRNKLPHKTQTAMEDSATEDCSQKILI